MKGFLNQHKDLALGKPQGVALNRVFGLEIILNEHHFEPHQIYNCNKTDITSQQK